MRRTLAIDIKRLETRRARALKRLIGAIRGHADLAVRLDLVLGVQVVGKRTAASLVVRMPELGRVSREQAAAIAGLAPFVHQSGQHQGEASEFAKRTARHIGGGRGRLRRALYMPAMAGATRHNPVLMALHDSLKCRGKPAKSALIACARKLLVMANAVVARGTPWENRSAAAA